MIAFDSAFQAFQTDPHIEIELQAIHYELPYLHAIFEYLRQWPEYTNWRYLLTSRQLRDTLHLAPNVVVFYVGNEDGYIPQGQYQHLFCFYAENDRPAPQVQILPLGWGAGNPLPFIPWQERKWDIFFAGQKMPLRQDFAHALKELHAFAQTKNWRVSLQFSEGFRLGLSLQAYQEAMTQTRLALIPQGWAPITFRLFEALQAGCIPVTPPLPDLWFLRGLPHIQLPSNWENICQYLNYALEDPQALRAMQRAVLAHYHKYCHPEAVAHFIQKELKVQK